MLNTENKHIEVPAHIATNWDSVVLLSLFQVTDKAFSALIEKTDKVINESAIFDGSRNKCRAA
jgi:DNA-binding HxlR family transcriptional regulator